MPCRSRQSPSSPRSRPLIAGGYGLAARTQTAAPRLIDLHAQPNQGERTMPSTTNASTTTRLDAVPDERADLLQELAQYKARVQELTDRLAAMTADELPVLDAAAPPACPTTGNLRPFNGSYETPEEALADARTLINLLVGALRPYTLFREQRVVDRDKDPRVVVDVTVPAKTLSNADRALTLYASFLRADQHRRTRTEQWPTHGEQTDTTPALHLAA